MHIQKRTVKILSFPGQDLNEYFPQEQMLQCTYIMQVYMCMCTLHVFIALHVHVGHAVFRSHALLLRGSLHALWRMENDALRDLQEVINTQGLPAEVKEC